MATEIRFDDFDALEYDPKEGGYVLKSGAATP